MPPLLSNQTAMADIGRVGCLELRYGRDGLRTILTASRCSTPWHFFPPAYLDDSGCAFTSLVNPSGGFVAGDHLSIHAALEEGAHVVMTTPSANRVYRSLGEESRQSVTLSVAPGAVIEWFPEVTIPYAGSRFVQTMAVTLAKGATALLWDSLASGRVARGERWAFTSLHNEIDLTTASGARLLERYHVRPEEEQAGLGLLAAYDYVASFFVVSDAVDPDRWPALRDTVAGILDSFGSDLLGGVTEPPTPGLAVKLVSRSPEALAMAQERLWEATRRAILGLARPALRHY
ncbi:MAG: urease accessory protein UreD [Nitrospira sp. NTP1]|nr:urease accessory protein UreD [Nitrospira sp. NTP1]